MEKLKELFTLLVNYHFRFKMIHWNSKGHNFNSIHGDSEECAMMLSKFIDEIAEIIKCMNGDIPSLIKCIRKGDDEFEIEEFDSDYAYNIMKEMVETLINKYQNISDDTLLKGIQSKFDHTAYELIVMRYKLNEKTKS